jgi:PhnB protein
MTIQELFPYIRVQGAAKAIEFYKQAFGATEKFRLTEPSGRIGHAELLFGAAIVMLSEEYPEYGIFGPRPGSEPSSLIHLHVDDCDAMIRRAIEHGAKLTREPKDQFYGERSGTVRDPFGYDWLIGHSIEAVEPAEMQRRYTEMLKSA